MSGPNSFDAYTPSQVARRIDEIGIVKARQAWLPMFVLGILAGAFIGLGALFYVLVSSDPSLGFAARRAFGGVAFSLGLLLVAVAGAELFTGNNLLAMAWADGKLSLVEVLRAWAIAGLGNLVGAAGLALLVYWSGHAEMNHGAIAREYVAIAAAKCALPFWTAFVRGVLCNILVCLAVWMAMAGRSVVDKAVAIVFPVSAFVAAGFEHSVANMYLIPIGMLLEAASGTGAPQLVTWTGFLGNLVPVLLGNVVGGSVLVALTYHLIYGQRNPKQD